MTKIILSLTVPALLAVLAMPVHATPTAGTGFQDASDLSSIVFKRSKPRIPGGSGCDDPMDVIEHPECRI